MEEEGEEQEDKEEEEVKGWELQTGGRRICSPARCNSEAFCQTTSTTRQKTTKDILANLEKESHSNIEHIYFCFLGRFQGSVLK